MVCEYSKIVCVRYVDHARFVNVTSKDVVPTIRETIGWLVADTDLYLTIVWDRRSSSIGDSKERDTGITLAKRLVLETKEVW